MRAGPSANPVVIRESAEGATRAAPAPCTTRELTSSTGSCARPPASDAAVNTAKPIMNMRRRPNVSAARPPRISSPPKAIAYPVTIHCTAVAEKPNSRSIDASATLTMLKSSTTMNAAVRISARASRRCEGAGPGRATSCSSGLALPAVTDVGITVPTYSILYVSFSLTTR